jgi:lipopolysaccharide export system permease protein
LVKGKIIFRYLLGELVTPFVLGICVFTFIFLMNRILKLTEMVVNKGIGLSLVLKLLVYTLPSFLVITIPMAVLLAAISALGRLSTDGVERGLVLLLAFPIHHQNENYE